MSDEISQKTPKKPKKTVVGFTEDMDPLLNKKKFETRRRMAWCMVAIFIFVTFYFLVYIPPESIASFEALISWIYGTIGAVIAGYMGTSAYAYVGYQNAKSRAANNQTEEEQ